MMDLNIKDKAVKFLEVNPKENLISLKVGQNFLRQKKALSIRVGL